MVVGGSGMSAAHVSTACISRIIVSSSKLISTSGLRLLFEHLGLDRNVFPELMGHVVETCGSQRNPDLVVSRILPVPSVNSWKRRRECARGLVSCLPFLVTLRVSTRRSVGLSMKFVTHTARRFPGVQPGCFANIPTAVRITRTRALLRRSEEVSVVRQRQRPDWAETDSPLAMAIERLAEPMA